jgi:acyl carrier protein
MSEHKTEVRQFIADNFMFGQDEDLADDSSFLAGGIVDSTGVLQIVAFLEERFAVAVSDLELVPENLDSIDAIAAFIARKQAAEGRAPSLK